MCAGMSASIELQSRLSMCSPTSTALGAGENPQWLYTVRFDGRELWGPDADPTVKISVDAWESYLERA